MANDITTVPEFCNFCEKGRTQVNKLIISGSHAICDSCVRTCSSLLNKLSRPTAAETGVAVKKFRNPQLIKQYLDQRVVGQHEAKVALSVGVVNHYKRLNYKGHNKPNKSNILMLGPTGSGKTHLARCVSECLGVPFVIADVTTLTEAGYVGEDTENVIARLLSAANGNVQQCEQGIVFLDEVDKLARKSDAGSSHRDPSGEGVQQALLKMLEGTSVSIARPGQPRASAEVLVNTSNILFIASGAFQGLQQQTQRQQRQNSLGFAGTTAATAEFGTRDLMQFGLIPEFVGRFAVTVQTQELSQDDLVAILQQPLGLVEKYAFYFQIDKVKLQFTPAALQALAEQALKFKTGARALSAVLEKLLTPHMFALPDYRSQKVQQLTFTEDSVTLGSAPETSQRSSKYHSVR